MDCIKEFTIILRLIVTKLSIKRYEKDCQGQKRRYPWMIEMQNGRGKAIKNPNGGKYCGKDTYICDATVSISMNDLDMFSLFSKADAYLGAFEQEYAFRYNLLGNFNKLYCLLKNEMGNQIGEAFKSL